MIDVKNALALIPTGLRSALLKEYSSIVENYAEHRWGPSELSGGRFCEVVYTILSGHASGTYESKPSKPNDFVGACRKLEQNKHVPRSFQILIPRLLPTLFEIRNNRGVGHVGGDVDPNPMDATAVLSMSSWTMAELIRVFHSLDISAAQDLVDALVERPVPMVWVGDGTKRVLDPKMNIRNQILLLLSSSTEPVKIDTLQDWLKYDNKAYLKKTVAKMDDERLIYMSGDKQTVRLLPPGSKFLSDFLK